MNRMNEGANILANNLVDTNLDNHDNLDNHNNLVDTNLDNHDNHDNLVDTNLDVIYKPWLRG